MNKLFIFGLGAVVGVGGTLATLAIMSNSRHKDDPIDIESDWEPVEVPEEKPVEKVEEKEVNKLDEKAVTEYNKKAEEYIKAEIPEKVYDSGIEPWEMTKEEFDESPFEKEYLTYFAIDDILADNNLNIIADDRCGDDYIGSLEANGDVYICNEDLEVNFKIHYYDEESYEESLANERDILAIGEEDDD